MPGALPPILVIIARITMLRIMPVLPNIISWRRPKRSIVKTCFAELLVLRTCMGIGVVKRTATQLKRKYSVPFAAARIRAIDGERPISF